MYLYEEIEQAKKYGAYAALPSIIPENLSAKFELRPYQKMAFQNFVTYFENDQLRRRPSQVLFHMATGSGKTLIMAGLMLYLYRHGYRNFLFFVNLSNIVEKTKENFMNPASSKYLFAEDIVIDGQRVVVQEVTNFQYSDPERINICFSTTQGLHHDMWFAKENGMTFDDFDGQRVVLISDEAHHLNVDTRRRLTAEEETSQRSWEMTVRNIFEKNPENVLLEFTATCDLMNLAIRAEYESKIVADYPLVRYYMDAYSKEIITLRSDLDLDDRALQALILSQYRLKVFQDRRLAIKPVVLFKATKIAESKEYMAHFIEWVGRLDAARIEGLLSATDSDVVKRAKAYFDDHGVSMDMLAQELREEFSGEHCISVNDDKEAERMQILLNSLEDSDNSYRAIFEVKKLDEGWDVLNLFDIVRLNERRQSGGRRISPATISEAQLIGRGARYCPFQFSEDQPKFQRKYDNDLENPARICEELYYHCQNDHRYVTELHQALREIGLDTESKVAVSYVLKDDFKHGSLYIEGLVFANERKARSNEDVYAIEPHVKDKFFSYTRRSGRTAREYILQDDSTVTDVSVAAARRWTVRDIADRSYAIVHKALRQYPTFRFNNVKRLYPNVQSMREFITSDSYLGNVAVDIHSAETEISNETLYQAMLYVASQIASAMNLTEQRYEGTTAFVPRRFHEVFHDRVVNISSPHDGGIGVSQNDYTVPGPCRIDLKSEDWFVYTDNFGTSEEKAFVAYFRGYVEELRKKYEAVYLVRNERELKLFSFDDGERFEPDYVLFLQKSRDVGYEQLQVFIEPKGTHLLSTDAWKESFLMQIRDRGHAVKLFADDNDYRIWGLHFFNREERITEFSEDLRVLCDVAQSN